MDLLKVETRMITVLLIGGNCSKVEGEPITVNINQIHNISKFVNKMFIYAVATMNIIALHLFPKNFPYAS